MDKKKRKVRPISKESFIIELAHEQDFLQLNKKAWMVHDDLNGPQENPTVVMDLSGLHFFQLTPTTYLAVPFSLLNY